MSPDICLDDAQSGRPGIRGEREDEGDVTIGMM